jgi:hypothetical protein
MRVRQDQATLLYRLVWEERGRMTKERGRWSSSFPTTTFNQIIAMLDVTKKQLETIADEEGWDLGEPWGSHQEGAGTPPPAVEPQPLGRRTRPIERGGWGQ